MQGKRVLIADDEPGLRRTLTLVLSQAGLDTTSAEDGQAALEAVQEATQAGRPFDLLVTDLQMPRLTGLELIDRLEAEGLGLPVLVITGHGDKDTVVTLLRKGCKEFIDKPFGPQDALTRVREVLERTEADRRRQSCAEERLKAEVDAYRSRFEALSRQIDAASAAYNELVTISPGSYRVPVAFCTRPLSRLGGDYAGVCDAPRGLHAMIADVAGHDAGASFHTVLLKAFFDENARQDAPGQNFLDLLNRQLIDHSKSERMVTALYLDLDLDRGAGSVASAAHPFLLRMTGDRVEPVFPGPAGQPLGILDQPRAAAQCFPLVPGERFFLYTDGVSGASRLEVDRNGWVRLGTEGLRGLLAATARLPLDRQVDQVWRDILAFCRQKPRDDMLLLGLEIPGPRTL